MSVMSVMSVMSFRVTKYSLMLCGGEREHESNKGSYREMIHLLLQMAGT